MNVRTGIDGPLYRIDLKILTFSILNEFDIPTATITLGGSTTFYVNVVPEGNMNET